MSRPLNSKDVRNNTKGFWSYLKNKLESLMGVCIDEDIAKGIFREVVKSIPEFLCNCEEDVLSIHGVGRFKVVKDGESYLLRMVVSEMMSKYIEELYTDEGEITYKESVKREDLGLRLRRCIEENVSSSVRSYAKRLKHGILDVLENSNIMVSLSKSGGSFYNSSGRYKNEFEIEDFDIVEPKEPSKVVSKTEDVAKYEKGENVGEDGLTEGMPSVSFEGYVFPADVKPNIDFNFD